MISRTMVNLATILITLLFVGSGNVGRVVSRRNKSLNGRIRFFTEDLLLLSREADYWVVLEVTVLIFQSSPSQISIEEGCAFDTAQA